MDDAKKAVVWAHENAARFGADPDRLYLCGHSAGGNIATLLATGPWIASLLEAGTVKGVIGMSGVYTVLRPMGGPLSSMKNRLYDRMYRLPVFGDEPSTLAKHSPTALLRLTSGASEPFRPRCAISEVMSDFAWQALGMESFLPGSTGSRSVPKSQVTGEPLWTSKNVADVKGSPVGLPPVMLLNASWDLGLEDDAAYFAKLLEARTGIKPAHHIIPNTNHTTVTWDETAFSHCKQFIADCEAGLAQGNAMATSAATAA